jgi:hypothetical protein
MSRSVDLTGIASSGHRMIEEEGSLRPDKENNMASGG